ncbi:hypothetical protein Tco_0868725, partial [Tanacetum coccineum]
KETIRVGYEWELPRCSTCLVFGHSVDDCSKAPKRAVNRVDIGNGGSYGADDDGFIEVKRKKSRGNNRGTKNLKPVSVKHKTIYHPKVNQSTAEVSPKTAPSAGIGTFSLSNLFGALNIDNTVIEEVDSGNKASMAGLQTKGNSFNPVVDKINMIEPQPMEGKCVLVDDDGKPLKKVDYSDDHDSEDEVEPVDNEMSSYLASKPSGIGYGTNSLLEQ